MQATREKHETKQRKEPEEQMDSWLWGEEREYP